MQRGVTLIEVMLALSILAIATTGAVMAIISNAHLSETNKESVIAAQAARRVINDIYDRASPRKFSEYFQRYNSTTADDITTDTDNPGDIFDVCDYYYCPTHYAVKQAAMPGVCSTCGQALVPHRRLLEPLPGKTYTGRILFPVVNGQLRETRTSASEHTAYTDAREQVLADGLAGLVGAPSMFDLNADTTPESAPADHATDYKMLPVIILVRWRGCDDQDHEFSLRTLLVDRKQ
jgi:prepilin-type N-terminal cleavage/methylation domain-containing protein